MHLIFEKNRTNKYQNLKTYNGMIFRSHFSSALSSCQEKHVKVVD